MSVVLILRKVKNIQQKFNAITLILQHNCDVIFYFLSLFVLLVDCSMLLVNLILEKIETLILMQ